MDSPLQTYFFGNKMKVAPITPRNLREARAVYMRAWSARDVSLLPLRGAAATNTSIGFPKEVLEDAWRQGRRKWATINAWNIAAVTEEGKIAGVMLCEHQWKKRRLC